MSRRQGGHHQHPGLRRPQPRHHHRARVDHLLAGAVAGADLPAGHPRRHRHRHHRRGSAAAPPRSPAAGVTGAHRFQHDAACACRDTRVHRHCVGPRIHRDDVDPRPVGADSSTQKRPILGSLRDERPVGDRADLHAVETLRLSASRPSARPAAATPCPRKLTSTPRPRASGLDATVSASRRFAARRRPWRRRCAVPR